MLHHTRGIVFHTSRYSDTSAIVKIYTEDFGIQSYLVKGLYSRKSRVRSALFGHLSVVDMVVERKEHKSLHFIKEVTVSMPMHGLQNHIAKSAIVLFVNELLYKCVKEEECNRPLFGFIVSSLQILDHTQASVQAFHLLFMLKLTRYLGFEPRLSKTDAGSYFDMEEGFFLDTEPLHRYFIAGEPARALEELQMMEFSDLESYKINRVVRDELLENLLDFYRLNIPEMGELKSLKVLQELLS